MELLEQVESYLARTKLPPSTFGRMALGDPRFVDDLRAGRKLRRKTQERVRCYLMRDSDQSVFLGSVKHQPDVGLPHLCGEGGQT